MTDGKCTNCMTYQYDCTYIEIAKKRGPPKGYVESLENRLEKMENLLRRVRISYVALSCGRWFLCLTRPRHTVFADPLVREARRCLDGQKAEAAFLRILDISLISLHLPDLPRSRFLKRAWTTYRTQHLGKGSKCIPCTSKSCHWSTGSRGVDCAAKRIGKPKRR